MVSRCAGKGVVPAAGGELVCSGTHNNWRRASCEINQPSSHTLTDSKKHFRNASTSATAVLSLVLVCSVAASSTQLPRHAMLPPSFSSAMNTHGPLCEALSVLCLDDESGMPSICAGLVCGQHNMFIGLALTSLAHGLSDITPLNKGAAAADAALANLYAIRNGVWD